MTEQQVQEQVAPETPPEPSVEPSTPNAKYTDKDVDKLKGGARKEGRSTGRTERDQELLSATGAESVDEVVEVFKAWQTVQEESSTEADKERKAREKAEAKLTELEPYKEQAERYAAAIEEQVTAQMEGLPEHLVEAIEGKDPVWKLQWLSKYHEEMATRQESTPAAPRGVPPTPKAHETSQTTQDAAAQQARQDARRSSRSRI